MIRKFSKTSLVALLGLVSSAGLVHAETIDSGSAQTATTTLVFVAPVSLQHTLTTETGLHAGNVPDQARVATGNVVATDSSNQLFAVRFKPDTGTKGTSPDIYTIAGKADAANNKLTLKLVPSQATSTDATDGWLYENAESASYGYSLQTSGAQSVTADTYIVTMQAATWVS